MKRIYLIAVLSFFTIANTYAQLQNTKWQGMLMIPDGTECYVEFRQDTATISTLKNNSLVEEMKYSIKSDTITFFKISGISPCDEGSPGIYKYRINDNTLLLTLISDECDVRANSGMTEGLTRIIPIKKE
jgi:hypothetical protein